MVLVPGERLGVVSARTTAPDFCQSRSSWLIQTTTKKTMMNQLYLLLACAFTAVSGLSDRALLLAHKKVTSEWSQKFNGDMCDNVLVQGRNFTGKPQKLLLHLFPQRRDQYASSHVPH
jgi:hypothetical protein